MAFSLSYNPDSYWRDDVNHRGIPIIGAPTRQETDVSRFIRNTFSMTAPNPQFAAAAAAPQTPRYPQSPAAYTASRLARSQQQQQQVPATNDCLLEPYGVQCAVGRAGRPYVFAPQKIHAQRVTDPDRPRCAFNNPLRRLPSQRLTPQESLAADDAPQVYVMDDATCATITPEVGPNEVTRDTTYSQMFWQNPVYTFPEVQDQNALAVGTIWNRQERASDDFNDAYYYPVYVKNTPMYYRYQNV